MKPPSVSTGTSGYNRPHRPRPRPTRPFRPHPSRVNLKEGKLDGVTEVLPYLQKPLISVEGSPGWWNRFLRYVRNTNEKVPGLYGLPLCAKNHEEFAYWIKPPYEALVFTFWRAHDGTTEKRLAWFELGLWIDQFWREETEEWRLEIERETGIKPKVWISPDRANPWDLALKVLRRHEPERYDNWDPMLPCWPVSAWHPGWKESKQANPPSQLRDPLILDLDGDGIETVGWLIGSYFDYQSDGFAETTGWVGSDDGLLVLDRNGDDVIDSGMELFGNDTILSNGSKARSGFEALADFDVNSDGKIDIIDPVFSKLGLLLGNDLNGSQIISVQDIGIKSIGLQSTLTGLTDQNGNTQLSSGRFEWISGVYGKVAEYSFLTDESRSIPLLNHTLTEEVANLPNLVGQGFVRDLHQEILFDSSGELRHLLEQFLLADEPDQRNIIVEQIIFKWTGSAEINPESGGDYIDGRALYALERWYGDAWVGRWGSYPDHSASIIITELYMNFSESVYSELMSQTHLLDLYKKIDWTWDDESKSSRANFSAVIPEILAELSNDPEQGKELLSEFARTLRGNSSCSHECYLVFRETMLEIDPDLGWIFDTGGLPVYDQLGQGDGRYYPHMWGTWNSDAVQGHPTAGDGYINGLTGDDVLYGTDRNEKFFQESGDALIVAGGGNDRIYAGDDDDILDGGTGNDVLYGERGNDTYIFRRGSGNDLIIDPDPTAGNTDKIWLGSNLAPDEIRLQRSGNNLVLSIIDTSDTLTVRDYFRNNSTLSRIEEIHFMDGHCPG